MCSFSSGCDGYIGHASILLNLELNEIAKRLKMRKNKWKLIKKKINNLLIEWATNFDILGFTVNWNTHKQKNSKKLSHTLCVINRLKLHFDLFSHEIDIWFVDHLQFEITNWGLEWKRISKLKQRALWIMTNSGYDANTEPLFKKLRLLEVKDIFDDICFVQKQVIIPVNN